MGPATKLILQYLASPETKSAVVTRLSQSPYDAFAAILGFRGPYPQTIHPIDVHEEYLTPLLAALLKACPQLLIGPKPARIPPRPFILIAAAIEANDPRFADTILSGLKDRSIDVKLAAVHGIRVSICGLTNPDFGLRIPEPASRPTQRMLPGHRRAM